MRALIPVSALLLGAAILLTGSGLQGLLLPIRAELEQYSTLEIGLISSSYFAGFAAGCVFGPRLVGAVGHIRAFTAMTAIGAAVALAHGFLVWPLGWWLFRIVTGFCFAVLYMVIESWLNASSTRETRGVVLSAYMIINLTVITLGQMLLPLQDPKGMELFAITSILISLAAVPVALTRSSAPPPIRSTAVNLRKLYRNSPAGCGACLAVGLANGPFWALGPQYAKANGLDEAGIALFMSVTVLGGALGQWPLGRLSDVGDRRRVIGLASILAAVAGSLMVVRPFESTTVLFVMAAAWGASAFPIYSLGVAHANDHADAGNFVETSSGLLLVYAAGAVLGPLVASFVTRAFGPATLYAHIAVVHAVLLAFMIWRTTQQAPVPDAEHVKFVEALRAATTVSPVFDAHTQSELESAQEKGAAESPPA